MYLNHSGVSRLIKGRKKKPPDTEREKNSVTAEKERHRCSGPWTPTTTPSTMPAGGTTATASVGTTCLGSRPGPILTIPKSPASGWGGKAGVQRAGCAGEEEAAYWSQTKSLNWNPPTALPIGVPSGADESNVQNCPKSSWRGKGEECTWDLPWRSVGGRVPKLSGKKLRVSLPRCGSKRRGEYRWSAVGHKGGPGPAQWNRWGRMDSKASRI